MTRIWKKIPTIAIYSLILIVLTSCSQNNTVAKSPSIKDIDNELNKSIDLSNMDMGNGEKLEKLYDIDPEDLEEFSLYVPKSNIEANEIGIFKIEDSTNLGEIKAKIEKRLEEQAAIFKDYLPEEYYLTENSLLKTKDDYILFVIYEDVELIEKIFDESFK